MKQTKSLRINTIEKDVDTTILKVKQEIVDLELSLEDKKEYLTQLEKIKQAIKG